MPESDEKYRGCKSVSVDGEGAERMNRTGLTRHLWSHPHRTGIIVNEESKIIYMKAGKTAGTSIYRNNLGLRIDGFFNRAEDQVVFKSWINGMTDEKLAEYFIFAFVRNPWDRFVSISAYLDVPFFDLVYNFDKVDHKSLKHHSIACSEYTHLNGKCFCDFVGRFEKLRVDFFELNMLLGLNQSVLEWSQMSHHKPYRTYYTEDMIQIVGARYAEDVKNYGYEF